MTTPLERLRHHVSGAIARGEAAPVVGIPAAPQDDRPFRLWSETGGAVGMFQRLEFATIEDAEMVRDRYRVAYSGVRFAVGRSAPDLGDAAWGA